jgi:hypothetical protein
MIDLNRLPFDGDNGLLERLAEITDHRKKRGIRHPLHSVLALAVAAVGGTQHFREQRVRCGWSPAGPDGAGCPLASDQTSTHPAPRCDVSA